MEGFEPTSGGVQGVSAPFGCIGETTFKRENDARDNGMQHMEHGVHVMNGDNEMGMQRLD